MQNIKKIKIDLYADGSDLNEIKYYNKFNFIKGFTTNPSLMKKSNVKNYEKFAIKSSSILKKNKNISFEVFSDDLGEMYNQAIKINSWGDNIFVKIPITNSKREYCLKLIKKLSMKKVKLNITAITTFDQGIKVINSLDKNTESIISIFAGRIADTGVDPEKIILKLKKKISSKKHKLLWASTRELFNIFQAQRSGCDIITISPNILAKLNLIGRDLKEYSLDTVKMFLKDAQDAKYKI